MLADLSFLGLELHRGDGASAWPIEARSVIRCRIECPRRAEAKGDGEQALIREACSPKTRSETGATVSPSVRSTPDARAAGQRQLPRLDRSFRLEVEQGEEVSLDILRDLVQGQVAQAPGREGVLQLDADLVEAQDRVGDEHGDQRDEEAVLELVEQGERERREEEDDEAADLDGVDVGQRRLEDALAGPDVIDQRGAFAVGLVEAESVHLVAPDGVLQEGGDRLDHVIRHVPRGEHPARLLAAEEVDERRDVALAAEAGPRDVREGGRPADDRLPPPRVVGAVGQRGHREVPRLVDDPPPELAGLPPALVARVGPEHEQQAQQGADHLVGADLDAHVVPGERHQADEVSDDAEGEDARQDAERGRPAKGERFLPEHPRGFRGHRRIGLSFPWN